MTPPPAGFDLDMTLIDSRPAIMASFAGVAADTGVAIDPAEVDGRLGIKLQDELAYWFPPADVDAAVRVYRRHYLRLLATHTTLLPGAPQALRQAEPPEPTAGDHYVKPISRSHRPGKIICR